MNRDGYNELYLSFETTRGVFNITSNYAYTTGTTIIYNNFPNSITAIKGTLLSDLIMPEYVYNIVLANTYYSGWSDSHGNPSGTYTNNHPIILDTSFAINLNIEKIKTQVIDCPAVVGRSMYNSLQYVFAGYLLDTPDHPLYILMQNNWKQNLVCYDSPMYDLDTSGIDLILYNYIDDSLHEVWSKDITGHNFTDFGMHTYENEYYFAFEGDTLFQFDAHENLLYQKIDNLPAGKHKWVKPYMYNQSISRLSISNGNSIKLYDFDITTDINDFNPNNLPSSFTLTQNYPNPFNPTTVFSYALPTKGNIKAEIFNILGQKIITLLDTEQPAGEHQLEWDASAQSSGIYLFKLTFDNQSKSIKTMLLK